MEFYIILMLFVSGHVGSYNFENKLKPNTDEVLQIIQQFIEIEFEGKHTFLNDYEISDYSDDNTVGTYLLSI